MVNFHRYDRDGNEISIAGAGVRLSTGKHVRNIVKPNAQKWFENGRNRSSGQERSCMVMSQLSKESDKTGSGYQNNFFIKGRLLRKHDKIRYKIRPSPVFGARKLKTNQNWAV